MGVERASTIPGTAPTILPLVNKRTTGFRFWRVAWLFVLTACSPAGPNLDAGSTAGGAAGGVTGGGGSAAGGSAAGGSAAGGSAAGGSAAGGSAAGGSAAGGSAAGGSAGGVPSDGGLLQFVDCPQFIANETVAIASITGGLATLLKLSDGGTRIEAFVGSDCALTRVRSMSAPTPTLFAKMVSDARSVLYYGTAGFSFVEFDLDAGVLQTLTRATSAISVTADGLTAYTAFVGDPQRSTRPNLSSNFSADSTFNPSLRLRFVNALVTRGDRVFALGSEDFNTPNQIFVLGLDGGVSATWGATTAFAPDGFCYFHGATLCGTTDLCIVDANCRHFSQWTAQGQQRARFSFGFTGPGSGQPRSVAAAPGARAWVLLLQPDGGHTLGVVSGL